MSQQPSQQKAAQPDAGAMRSFHARSFTAWRSPGRFTKNPDLVRFPSGRLMFIYSDNDQHWSQETQVLTLVASDDDGKTWYKFNEIARADLRKGDERLVTPRLSLLSDGRLVALIDHDDFGHFHEDQTLGNWIFWSSDGGKTWTPPEVPNIPGFEPDRVVELPDGRLAIGSQVMRGDTQEFAEIFCTSDDNGRTWKESATIAHDGHHRLCEGAIVVIDRKDGRGQELACVMRENHSSGVPSLVSFSQDGGRSWTAPAYCPFAIHRPYAKQLPDGRVLVTGRHVNGITGCVAWAGDLRAEAGQHHIGGPQAPELATLTSEALVITSLESRVGCRYAMLPPESNFSEVFFEARLRVAGGEPGKAVALMSLCKILTLSRTSPALWIGTDFICLGNGGVDAQKKVDMTRYRTITMHHRRGLLTVQVDGQTLINACVVREEVAQDGWTSGEPTGRTMFGNSWDGGTSFWQSVSYRHTNRSLPSWAWDWKAGDGVHPDDYQRRRLVQLHGNPPTHGGIDNGYSSWVVLPNGSIVFVDYSSQGDAPGKAHIVGLHFHPNEIP